MAEGGAGGVGAEDGVEGCWGGKIGDEDFFGSLGGFDGLVFVDAGSGDSD